MKKKILALAGATLAAVSLAACSAASTADWNNQQAADNFEIQRRVVFINGITDTYLLEIQGRCSITDETSSEAGGQQLEVVCKVGDKQFEKHMLGLSDNVSYFVEQLEPNESDPYHYDVRFRPETIVPDIKIDTTAGEVG